MKIISKPSPNFELKAKRRIKYIIIHYTNLPSTQSSLKYLLNKKNKVSAHYLLDQKGNIYSLVNEKDIAWHAGTSSWKADKLLNKKSIGIELQNTGIAGNYEEFPNQQISQLEKLILELQNKYNISNANILGHSDISPDRKIDPGPKFPWQRLFKNGIGLMPKTYSSKSKKNITSNEIKNLQILLKKFGYNLKVNGFMDKQTLLVLYAFQSHYCPNELSVPDNNLNLPRYLKELIKLQSQ
ncbi:N-acetylmuramoyl-L-alanine amidase [Pelagibacteraceae bacterium]|nr:N-acetylmuramoyl-L-alanine amidase [Pelagibacteraceae bacterium]